MYICFEGCAHGDLDRIYEMIETHHRKVDLLICCGDFQATRNREDLACMAVPSKYLEMGTFYKYYSGEKVAPVLTIFIGGNHEASNHLQELAYGGWVAPKIYYMGYAGVIKVNGIRIGGISGIYRDYNYTKGHYECPPYDNNTVRTVYSMRNLEVFRIMQLAPCKLDIMLSHDWPQKIWDYGDNSKRFGSINSLLKRKPDFKADMDSGKLGNPPCMEVLKKIKPHNWYSAHMHCRFDAVVPHEENETFTRFVALDKCLTGRQFFDFLSIGEDCERNEDGTPILKLEYDPEWLTILYLTNKFLNCTTSDTNLPYEPSPIEADNQQRWNFTPTDEEIQTILNKFQNDLTLKENFKQTANSYDPKWDRDLKNLKMPMPALNIQTTEFCEKLGIDDPLFIASNFNNVKVLVPNYSSDQEAFQDCNIVSESQVPPKKPQLSLPKPVNDDEINLDELEDDADEGNELLGTKSAELEKNEDLQQEVQIQLNESTDETKNEVNEAGTQPAVKKFKRRNQEIYSATDE